MQDIVNSLVSDVNVVKTVLGYIKTSANAALGFSNELHSARW